MSMAVSSQQLNFIKSVLRLLSVIVILNLLVVVSSADTDSYSIRYFIPFDAPNITGYWNSINGFNQTTMAINIANSASFNVTVDQIINNVSWKIEGIEQQNTSALTFNHLFSSLGIFNVTAQAFNANGSSNIIYTVVTVSEGGGGGTDYDWAQGYAKYPNGTGISGVAVTTSQGATSTNGAGYYSFGYVFIHGSNYTFNFTKVGFDYNLTYGNFSVGDYQWVNVTMDIVYVPPPNPAPIILSWGNNKTNDSTLAFYANKSDFIGFNFTANQTLTSCSWSGATEINCTGFNSYASRNFTTSGVHLVTAQGTSANGSTQIVTWTITVNASIGLVLSGFVFNTLEAPIEKARVDFNGIHVFTDSSGYYNFSNVNEAAYDTLARAIGYENTSKPVSITGNTTLNFTLPEKSDSIISGISELLGMILLAGAFGGILAYILLRKRRKSNAKLNDEWED